ncbi:PilZ domain-containing protein [Sphingomonas lenta]|uniref:PilZ domain-containing protein n=1 Tax=Sphingomonas lenta TaxID=1141887 RepID=A0A2A2SB96_9SPHN|nr:PilZ domain-containing protein [Sphingomonas lenta]PAX06526.1 PilZ domain-containing protein [Sphingomonas lenta]
MQAGLRPREPRVKVLVPCRMNVSGRWVDVCVHNASSRGLLVAADEAPGTGAYIDIRRGTLVIIGRVVWRKGRFFGVRTQDRLSVQALVSEPRRGPHGASASSPLSEERRTQSRLAAEGRVARRVEHSRQTSSRLQFGFLVLAAAAIAMFMADEVGLMLAQPLTAVSAALDGHVGS